MKVELWRDSRNEIRRFEIGALTPRLNNYNFDMLGHEEINMIEKPKKTVVKEAFENIFDSSSLEWAAKKFLVPLKAKNIKCTYEIEE